MGMTSTPERLLLDIIQEDAGLLGIAT